MNIPKKSDRDKPPQDAAPGPLRAVNADIALGNEILRGVVGSTALGTAIEGQDDRDEMGIFIEPPAYVCGLETCDHYIQRDQPDGVRSQPGDLDLTLYSLRKFCRLAAKGNPTVIVLLWLPEYLKMTDIGRDLVAMRQSFVSKESGARFLGYLTSQKMRLTGEKSKKVTRPDLVEKYGYDTKFAMHALRLGLQGIEILRTRNLVLPMEGNHLRLLRDVRTGKLSFDQVMIEIDRAERELAGHYRECTMVADRVAINQFLIGAHQRYWRQP